MLTNPIIQSDPFWFFCCNQAFSPADFKLLESTFAADNDWQDRDAAFYQCSIRDCSNDLPQTFLSNVVARMRDITGLPLLDKVQVTSQQMNPGQLIGIHSDRSMLGYEAVRLVLLLNTDWRPEYGGTLELYRSHESPAVVQVPADNNVAFGFVLHEASYHAVSEVTRPRRSMVFNFWHPANSPALEHAISRLLAAPNFAELPATLDATMSQAEATFDEDTTFAASLTALVLRRWGYDDATLLAAYRYKVGLTSELMLTTEDRAATLLASWVARLYQHPFDLELWSVLQDELRGQGPYARLKAMWDLCLPVSGERVAKP